MASFGTLPGQFPIPAEGEVFPPGTPPGPTGSGGVASPNAGAGWEIKVVSYADYTTELCQIPPKMITGITFTEQLDDIGSGTITLNQDDPWWKSSPLLPGGLAKTTILDYECLWQVWQDGVVRFEFLGETITEQLVDPSEQRIVTVTGPGTIAVLKWGMAAPEGFPNIILKLDGLVDDFDEVDDNGNAVLDTNIWNQVSPAADVYITPVQGLYTYPGGALYQLSTLYPSGTLTIEATPGTTYLGTEAWDATDTLISAQVNPVGQVSSATDASGNAEPYGTGLDGSELTQFYIQSLKNSSYYAMIGLSHDAFYCQEAGPSGTFTSVLKTYDPTNDAYWMITEQGGTGGGHGTFYFWTSPDGQTWTQQWTVVHDWDATEVGFYVTATYDFSGQSAQISNLNSNVTTPSYQGNIYLGEPIMAIYTDLLQTAQARGTIPMVAYGFNATADSFGQAWTDSQNVQVTNGTDMYSLLQSFCQVVNADYVMKPGFKLVVGITEQTDVELGVDRSQQIIFRPGFDCMTVQRSRARNQIANLIGAENNDGREISAADAVSAESWGQREGWYQTSAQVDPDSMAIAAAATAEQNATEILSQTLTIKPLVTGKTVFQDFDVGDWVGLERPDFSAVDAVRVMAIAVTIDQTGAETDELTIVTYVQYLEQQLTYIANKLGGQFVNALGTTPVAPSKYGTGQVPTYFTPSASLANLSDVVGTKGNSQGTPLVYNATTGQWQPAGSASASNQDQLGVAVVGSDGTVTTIGEGGTIVSAPTTQPADGGGAITPGPQAGTGPGGFSVVDSDGITRVVAGLQGDGSFTTVDSGAGPPSIPDTPGVVGGILGLIVSWDGLLASANPLLDFQWVEVHCSTTSGFTPSSVTLQGTMSSAGLFGIGNLTAGTTYYVKLVAYNTSGTASTASTQASGVPTSVPANIPAGSISGTAIQTGTITATQISATAGIMGTQLASNAGIVAGQVSFNAAAIGGIAVSISNTAPGSPSTNELWFDGSAGYQLNQWNGSAWVPYQYGTSALAAGSITAAIIAANTITAAQIAAGTITATQIAAATITGSLIAAGTITGGLIAAGTITASNIATGTLTAAQIAAGSITSGAIAAGAIDGLTINGVTINGFTVSAADLIVSGNNGGLFAYNTGGTQVLTIVASGSGSWKAPAGVTSVYVECWGAGGGGSYPETSGPLGGTGGGGGEYAANSAYSVTPGNTYNYTVGAGGGGGTSGSPTGGNGGATTFDTGGTGVKANPGGGGSQPGSGGGSGQGGSGSSAPIENQGGKGNPTGSAEHGMGGGSSGGPQGAGTGDNIDTLAGGSAGPDQGPGGNGGSSVGPKPGSAGGGPGGGGGGGGVTGGGTGANGAQGAAGQIRLTFTAATPELIAAVAGAATTDPIAGDGVGAGVTLYNQTSAPAGVTGAGLLYGSGGHEKYVSTDTNVYNTGRLSLVTASSQIISATTPGVAITGLSATCQPGTYRVFGIVAYDENASAGTPNFYFTAPTATNVLMCFIWRSRGAASPTFSTGTAVAFGSGAAVSGPTMSSANKVIEINGVFTATGSTGGFALNAYTSSGSDTFTIQPQSFLDLMPIS